MVDINGVIVVSDCESFDFNGKYTTDDKHGVVINNDMKSNVSGDIVCLQQ